MLKKIILLKPRGFCAGVDRAIAIVEKTLEIHGAPIYVRHQIVHNPYVIKSLEEKGAIFVESLDEISDDFATIIFSAHGVPPKTRKEALKRGFRVIDATCPLVTKVHLEAVRFHNEGYSLIIIGHKGHQEVVGTMGEAPMQLIETLADIENLTVPNPDKVAAITQTTLSVDDTKDIITTLQKKFPSLKTSPAKDICYATQNRQDAVKTLGKACDFILVIGAENSSNSNRLVETAIKCGRKAQLIPSASAITDRLLEGITTIGITSGASVPEILVEEVVTELKNRFPSAQIETLKVIDENLKFALPPELK